MNTDGVVSHEHLYTSGGLNKWLVSLELLHCNACFD